MAQALQVTDCPYGAKDCPKVEEIKHEQTNISHKLDILFAVVIALHGAEILALLGGMA